MESAVRLMSIFAAHALAVFDLMGASGLGLGLYHTLEGAGSIGKIAVNLNQNSVNSRLTDVNITIEKGWSKVKKVGAFFGVVEQVRSESDFDTIANAHIRHHPDIEIQKDVTSKTTTLQLKLTPKTLPPSMTWSDHVVVWRMHLSIYLKNGQKRTHSFDFEVKL